MTQARKRGKKRDQETEEKRVGLPDLPFADELPEEWLAWYQALMRSFADSDVAVLPRQMESSDPESGRADE